MEKHVLELDDNAEVVFAIIKGGERIYGVPIKGEPSNQTAMYIFFSAFLCALKEQEKCVKDHSPEGLFLVRKAFKSGTLEQCVDLFQFLSEETQRLKKLPEKEFETEIDALADEIWKIIGKTPNKKK
jgi:hypothetical protein